LASKLFDGLHGAISSIGSDIAGKLGTHYEPQPYGTYAGPAGYGAEGASRNRFGSFASPKDGNDVKWHVDGCSYMWAVSKALEGARESIWILDCTSCPHFQDIVTNRPIGWLSPELYLRRPPAKNAQYRLDRMLQQAAQRGVRVNVIVYKEVRSEWHTSVPKTNIYGRSLKYCRVSFYPRISPNTCIVSFHAQRMRSPRP
jgi:phospholipase D1/2